MKKLLITCAAAALSAGLFSPGYAQNAPQPMAPIQGSQMAPGNPGIAGVQANLTGQTIYNSKGTKIGTVSSMTIGAHGKREAVVSIGKFLGMGGKKVEFPVSSLKARQGGGYTTSLTSAEIKKLPAFTGGGGD